MDKYAGPRLQMMVAGTLFPIKLGVLTMMSGKALINSMLALRLSAILALNKLASDSGGHSGHGGTTYEVINVPSRGGHGPHGWFAEGPRHGIRPSSTSGNLANAHSIGRRA